MDALLLEKAETQQCLALSRKELDKTRQQAQVNCKKDTVQYQTCATDQFYLNYRAFFQKLSTSVFIWSL